LRDGTTSILTKLWGALIELNTGHSPLDCFLSGFSFVGGNVKGVTTPSGRVGVPFCRGRDDWCRSPLAMPALKNGSEETETLLLCMRAVALVLWFRNMPGKTDVRVELPDVVIPEVTVVSEILRMWAV
jgi:hypothetical protein